jgi:hypothetical protein
MKKTNPSKANGTSYKGIVKASFNHMVKVFGEPNAGPSFDGKVFNEWVLKTDDNLVATVYDWKSDVNIRETPDEPYEWHVGGHKSQVVVDVFNALN